MPRTRLSTDSLLWVQFRFKLENGFARRMFFSSLQSRFKFPHYSQGSTLLIAMYLLTLRVDDLPAQKLPGFGPKFALPFDRKAGAIGAGSEIGFPCMPSCLCNVRRQATEDWLTAVERRPVCSDGTVKGSPSASPLAVRHAPQHQNFTWTSPIAAFIANIDVLRIDLSPLVIERVVVFKCCFRSDGEGLHYHGSFNHRQL